MAGLEPGRFTRLGMRTLWFGQREGTRLAPVFLSDRSHPARPVWVFAERAELLAGADGGGTRLRLIEGDLHQLSEGDRQPGGPGRRQLSFATLELALDDADRGARALEAAAQGPGLRRAAGRSLASAS